MTPDDPVSKAETTICDAITSLQDALKHLLRGDKESYQQALDYIDSAKQYVYEAGEMIQRARDAEPPPSGS